MVRHQFGCYDEIQEVDNQTVRHCNWIRFLRVSNTPNSADVNLVGIKVYGEPVYEIVKTVRPNTELVVFYDLTANHLKRGARSAMMVHNHQNVHHDRFNNQENQSRMTPEQYKYTMNAIIEDSPLDLSLSLLSSRILITPPSDSEDSKCSEAPPSPSDKSDISIKVKSRMFVTYVAKDSAPQAL
ncbi:hypothetical protein GQR58_018098 [Nymphon striatum]|nr:hypothetical protein GQR58_018098 [Nymphon striatum]